jgi:hypothetical protein
MRRLFARDAEGNQGEDGNEQNKDSANQGEAVITTTTIDTPTPTQDAQHRKGNHYP